MSQLRQADTRGRRVCPCPSASCSRSCRTAITKPSKKHQCPRAMSVGFGIQCERLSFQDRKHVTGARGRAEKLLAIGGCLAAVAMASGF